MFPNVAVEIYASDYFINVNETVCYISMGSIPQYQNILLLGDTLFYNYIISFNKL